MANIKKYGLGILLPLAAGGLSAFLTGDFGGVYESLRQPPLSPPAIVFPVVWSVLYLLMGLSSVWIYNKNDPAGSEALTLYGVQLAVNVLWPLLFFKLEWRLIAFFWLLLLFVLVTDMVVKFMRIDPKAGWINLPYLGWLLFAAYLNLSTYFLNR